MIRKFQVIGLAMVGALALSAIGASAAQAGFTANSYPKSYTATSAAGNEVFTTEGGTIECAGHFEGTLTEASESTDVTPTYTKCQAFGFVEASVITNGCKYRWTRNSAISVGVDITCPLNKTLTVVASTCEIQFPPQNGLLSVSISNTFLVDIDAKFNLSGITYNVTKDGFLCPFNGTGHRTGAKYVQAVGVTVTPFGGSLSFE